jgi:hypothetical protein
MASQRPPLDPAAFRAVCAYASEHVILPDDVIRFAAGPRPREPFLIDFSRVSRSFAHGRRYLGILSELYRGNTAKFEEVAPTIRGRIRTYFGRTREEIESTGSSNEAAPIPETPWFATVNNSDAKRSDIVQTLMTHMGGFSYEYIRMVSRFCVRSVTELPSAYARALSKSTNA